MSAPEVPSVLIAPDAAEGPTRIRLVGEEEAPAAVAAEGEAALALAAALEFRGRVGQALPLSGETPRRLLAGRGRGAPEPAVRALAGRLPPGDYLLEGEGDAAACALAFAQGAYAFDRYKREPRPGPRLVVADPGALAEARRLAQACALARDLVNTPANDLGPAEIEAAARRLAEAHGAEISVTSGEALRAGYPAVHAVGRAAAPGREPRMVEIRWSGPGTDAAAPLVVLIGKGVVFDSGGLDIKPSSGMRWMKKDMGGAAHALALGGVLMDAKLPIRLHVLAPAVENAVSGDSMRPGDVLASRAGLTIEVGNTDAEGRLILADALARAAESDPDLTISLATLTGAARVALGPEVVPFYCDDDALAAELSASSRRMADPLWRLPLWDGYEASLDSDVADLKNDPDAWAQAGSVTAALFLRRFAPRTGAFLHLDIFAWNPRGRPGWPQGAEAQGILALQDLIRRRRPA